MWLVKMTWIGEDPIHITATVLQGVLLALTPLAILFSAFVFFNALNVTQTMPYMAALVRATCSSHPVAEVMLVLWALGHLIEGASGFGTGPAMLPPIMVALGHPAFESLVCLLIMTSTIGPLGSSGVGLWFGLSALEWSRQQLVRVTVLVSLVMALMSFPIALMSARFLLSWDDLRGCWLFVGLSIAACALPALLASLFSFEAPGLLSGVLGVVLTGAMAHKGVGLSANVPCVAARKLRQLEAGAAAALGGAGEPGEQQQQQAAASGGGSLEPLASKCGGGGGGSDDDSKQASRGRPVIELTAVATTPRGLAGLQEAPLRGRSAATEVCTDAAQGLLAALVSQTRRGGVPAAVGLAEEAEDGEGALLPSGAARSHHDTTACALERSALAASSRSGGGGGQLLGDARLGDAGSHAVDADTAAYLRDRRELARRLAPWAAMLCVVAGTRVPYLQRSNGQELRLSLRSLGDFTISSNLVLQFRDLCRIGVNWSFPLLYTPALLPFIATACATLAAFRGSIPADKSWGDPFAAATAKCRGVAPAIIGALILVALMVQGGRQAPSYIIGYWLSEWLGRGFIAVSLPLGAVGSFFSGSVSTSNLTFALLQQVAAHKLGLNATAMVMLQIIGGAAGQMVAISNILGGRAVMGIQHIPEGEFVKAALPACVAYYVAGTLLALPFLFS
ncbi:lactate permease [Micractinium conductrix]|uniref:Lactate permease n=1 Tax=Micractinium conductrix TaxID=554055 RepID=A0A2P6V955_9CHLO|nr:lactate permease [Micractinium conductrix]|eukprot:PSC70611.1 lactate permease [Micractinium conductrix]